MKNKISETSLDIKDWFDLINKTPIKIDVWITDPPYPFSNKNGSGRFSYDNGVDGMYSRLEWSDMQSIFSSMISSSNDGARAYVFCNRDGLFKTKDFMEKSGWKFRNLLVWDKKNMGMGYHWRNKAEYIVYATKGKPLTFVKNMGNIFSYKKPRGGHTSQKPFEIWSDILTNGVIDGDICADPFSGTNPMKKAILSDTTIINKIGAAYTNSF